MDWEGIKEQMIEGADERLNALVLLLILSSLSVLVAWRLRFFHLSPAQPFLPFVRWTHVLGAFGVLLLSQFIFMPVLAATLFALIYRSTDFTQLVHDPLLQGWVNILGMFLSAALLLAYTRYLQLHENIWGRTALKNLGLGILTWLVAFPITSAVGQLVALLLLLIDPTIDLTIDQTAVSYLKTTIPYPLLLTATIISLVCIVPIFEELLFRGYLQSWLRQWGRWKAIVLTSLIFAAFHFATVQKMMNIELLSSLFTLSLFLGFLYERQRSLLASIGLHMTFNAISVAMILYT